MSTTSISVARYLFTLSKQLIALENNRSVEETKEE